MDYPSFTLDAIIPVLKQTALGCYSIAIAGAHAKGTADSSSDLDIYLFADDFKSCSERQSLISAIANPNMPVSISKDADSAIWGGSMDFYYGNLPVEVNFRTYALVDQIVNESLSGQFKIIPATWTSNGYYTYIYLSELNFMVPVWDPDGRLMIYKKQIAQYPEPLRQAIISRFMKRSEVWLDSFHYTTAISRCDLLFTAPIVLHTVLDMVQVVFALNRVYFNGDKKLETALQAMSLCPEELKTDIAFLLNTQQDSAHLTRQRDILRRIRDKLKMLLQQEI